MKNYQYSNVRILIFIGSITVILSSWALKNINYAIVGSIIYSIALLSDTVKLIIESRKFKVGEATKYHERKIDKTMRLIESIVIVGSLIAMAHPNVLYSIPGKTFWYGQIIVFILVGPIIGIFANVELELTYGGWRPRRYRRYK